MVRARRESGFTLIELLVVIAIIAILIALLVPAVQKVREAAARAQCANNLKQMALGVHAHSDVKKILPPGAIQTGANGTVTYTTWTIEILPYIEQGALYNKYNQQLPNTDNANYAVVGLQRISTYECPSDPRNGKTSIPASGPDTTRPWIHGSYRGVSGRGTDTTLAGSTDGRGFWDTFEPQFWVNCQLDRGWRGPLHSMYTYPGVPKTATAPTVTACPGVTLGAMGGPSRITDIRDGTSNTLMIGECTFQDNFRRSTFWAYGYASYNQSSVTRQPRTLNHYYGTNNNNQCTAGIGCWGTSVPPCGANLDHACKRAFGSLHGGGSGLNFALCDGSVRYVTYGSDITLLANMATMAAGEAETLKN